MDRDLRRQRPGEALYWGEIDWALQEGLRLFDLEGIDREHNPGTYDFKRRMGGTEVALPGKSAMPLTLAGRGGAWALRHLLRV
jgi:CelD/BcsL family acetyltransferase involved in cellulose biosynthesis